MGRLWTKIEKDYIRDNLFMTSKEIAEALGRSAGAVSQMIDEMGLTRSGIATRPGIKSQFTNADIDFIHENIDTLTNRQIADRLGKTLTVVRNKIYELGLKRFSRKEEWTRAQEEFLTDNYRMTGDVELAEMMNEIFTTSQRKFGRGTIRKKRKLLGLIRSKEEVKAILEDENHKARCNTILRNSASLNYKDGWVANCLATKKHPEQIQVYKQFPALIELKRAQLQLKRTLKQQNDDNSSNSIL